MVRYDTIRYDTILYNAIQYSTTQQCNVMWWDYTHHPHWGNSNVTEVNLPNGNMKKSGKYIDSATILKHVSSSHWLNLSLGHWWGPLKCGSGFEKIISLFTSELVQTSGLDASQIPPWGGVWRRRTLSCSRTQGWTDHRSSGGFGNVFVFSCWKQELAV